MTTFITGGTSSIGRVLVKTLASQGEELRVLARPTSNRSGLELPGVTFIEGDVTNPQSVRTGMAGCTHVTHLAAVVAANVPEETWWTVNRDGTRNVLQAALDLGVEKMVQVSSISVLGPTQPGEIADETRPVDTRQYTGLYQKTKHAADDLAREYAAQGLAVSIVYPCFGFGCSTASSHPSLQDQTLLRMASGQPAAIMGSGKNRLTIAYYRDTVRGIWFAHQNGRNGDDYILGGETLTFTDIWKHVAAVLGKQSPNRHIPLPLLKLMARASRLATGRSLFPPDFFDLIGKNWAFRSTKAERELGWTFTPFATAVQETWQEYQSSGWRPGQQPR